MRGHALLDEAAWSRVVEQCVPLDLEHTQDRQRGSSHASPRDPPRDPPRGQSRATFTQSADHVDTVAEDQGKSGRDQIKSDAMAIICLGDTTISQLAQAHMYKWSDTTRISPIFHPLLGLDLASYPGPHLSQVLHRRGLQSVGSSISNAAETFRIFQQWANNSDNARNRVDALTKQDLFRHAFQECSS